MRLFVCRDVAAKEEQRMTTNPKTRVKEFGLLMRSLPAPALALMILTLFCMNLLANKSLSLPLPWLALDCGIVFSWITFLIMDVVTKHFGPRAATQMSLFAVGVNLAFCLLLLLASRLPGTWSAAYDLGNLPLVNRALDQTFGGTWYVLLGSTVAFAVSAAVNNYLNAAIGKAMRSKTQGYKAFALRTYLSTAAGQFVDNLVFSLLVSHVFFGWTLTQCVACAFTGMLAELLCEVVFSPIGYRICVAWRRQQVGQVYLEAMGMEKRA